MIFDFLSLASRLFLTNSSLESSLAGKGDRDDSDEPYCQDRFCCCVVSAACGGCARRQLQAQQQPADFLQPGSFAGKLNTATCKSYAYVFNTKTSEYFRCQVTLALTRDNKEVINVQTDGGCIKKPRIFDTNSDIPFDATETEPPNTNSFFEPGGSVDLGQ